jgi:hypothetical protein
MPFHTAAGRFAGIALVWQKINEDMQFQYITVISADEPTGLSAKPLELDPRPLSELEARLEFVDEKLESLGWERVALDRWYTLLHRDLDAADDEVVRMDASDAADCRRTCLCNSGLGSPFDT